jgi:hypothetical protein
MEGNHGLSSGVGVKCRHPSAGPALKELAAALDRLSVETPQPPRAWVCLACKNDYSIEVDLSF